MAAVGEEDRVRELVSQAEKMRQEGDRAKAYGLAREALKLQPQDPAVIKLLGDLQDDPEGAKLVADCEAFVADWDKEPGKRFRDELEVQGSTLTYEQARHCLDLIYDRICPDAKLALLSGDCAKNLLFHSHAAKQAIAERCIANLTSTFERSWDLGEWTFNRLQGVLISRKEFWSSDEQWRRAIQGAFQLSLAKVIDAGEENTEWALNAVVLLSKDNPEASQIKDVIDADTFAIILDSMVVGASKGMKTSALIATKLLLDASEGQGEQYVKQYVITKVRFGKTDDLIHGFSAASCIFPLLPETAAQLFMTEGFLEGLVKKLKSNNAAAQGGRSRKLEQAALELISSACRDKACRTAIAKQCRPWLEDTLQKDTEAGSRATAGLILVKIKDSKGDEKRDGNETLYLATKLANILLDAQPDRVARDATEGISYLSLEPRIKEMLVKNDRLLQKLITLLKIPPDSDSMEDFDFAFGYGTILMVMNLVKYREKQTEEERKMEQLRAYSEHRTPESQDPLDDDKHVEARCRLVAATEIVPVILSRVQDSPDKNLGFVSGILVALAKDKRNRARLAQQGAVKALVQIYGHLKQVKSIDDNDRSLLDTSHALARLLISLNPNHVFSASLPVTSALRPLVDLLNLNDPMVPILATFEGLLALTNIASMDDAAARDALIRTSFSAIEHLLLFDHDALRRAATELICNLMASPSTVALYADGTPNAKRRMHLLMALTDADDLATRSAAGGALAMLCEYQPGCEAVLDREKGIENILGLLKEEGQGAEGLMHRALVILDLMLEAEGDIGQKAKEKIKAGNGAELVKKALQRTRDGNVLTIGVAVLKKLG